MGQIVQRAGRGWEVCGVVFVGQEGDGVVFVGQEGDGMSVFCVWQLCWKMLPGLPPALRGLRTCEAKHEGCWRWELAFSNGIESNFNKSRWGQTWLQVQNNSSSQNSPVVHTMERSWEFLGQFFALPQTSCVTFRQSLNLCLHHLWSSRAWDSLCRWKLVSNSAVIIQVKY